MKRSLVLFCLLPLVWALILATGLLVYTFNQDPAGLARALSARVSHPEAGLTLSAQQARLSLFPLPSAKVEQLVLRTPDMALFVDACTLSPDWWELLHGRLRVTGLSLDGPTLLLRRSTPPATGTPDNPSEPSAVALPPQLAGMEVSLENGTVAALTLKATGGLRPKWSLSGLSGSCTLPEADEPGELTLTAQRAEWHGTAEEPARTVRDARFRLTNVTLESERAFRLNADAAFPLPFEGAPRFALTLSAEAREDTLTVKGAASLDGAFSLKRQTVPVHTLVPFSAEASLPERLGETDLPALDIKGAELKIDGDAASLDGQFLLAKNEQDGLVPTLRGTLEVVRLSLPRWFGFARDLPPGVQAALDDLTGTLPFELTPKRLSVTNAKATALDTVFKGAGGVSDFAKPVVELDMTTQDAPINRIFPELENRRISAPQYEVPPLVGGDEPSDTEGPDYDIRLSARRAAFWKWTGNDASVRIMPDPGNTDQTRIGIRCGSLYGGSAQAELVPGDVLSLSLAANGVNAEKLVTPLAGHAFVKGTLSGSAKLTARPSSLAAFLSSVKGSAEIRLEKGTLTPTRTGRPLAFSQGGLSFQGAGSRTQGAQPQYAYSGQWRANLTTADWQGALSLTGPLLFPASGPFGLRAEGVPASGNGSMKGVNAQATGTLSFDTRRGALNVDNAKGQFDMKGATGRFSGSARGSQLDKSPVWEAALSCSTDNLRALLARWDLLPSGLSPRMPGQARAGAKVRLDDNAVTISELEGSVDATRFSGRIERLKGTPPRWNADLRLGALNLSDYLPSSKGNTSSGGPWNVNRLKSLDLEGQLKAERLTVARIPHENLSAPITIRDGVLTADPIKARVAGGTAGAGFRAETASGGLLARLRYTLKSVNVLTLCRERGQEQLLSGKGDLDADVKGLLRSGADIPAALNGTLSFIIRNGELDARRPGGLNRFSSLSASGNLSGGVLTTRDLNLSGALSVRGYGSINLLNWTLDYALNVTGPGIPNIPVRYYGSLNAPQRSFNATGILANALNSIGSGFLTILDGVVSAPLRFLAP